MSLTARALLFDLDGTLIDSLGAVERAWSRWATGRGLEPGEVLRVIHGRRSIDTLRAAFPQFDAEAEDLVLRRIESEDTEGVVALPGVLEFLAALPPDRWTVVTSGTADVAQARLRAAGLPVPAGAVYGGDVTHGKPSGEPYALGATRLGLDPAECLVFEDVAAGVTAALAAGARAVAVAPLEDPRAVARITDWRKVSVTVGAGLTLEIRP